MREYVINMQGGGIYQGDSKTIFVYKLVAGADYLTATMNNGAIAATAF